VYGALDSRWLVALTAVGLSTAARIIGRQRADARLEAFESRFVFSGWPHHGYGWINLHASRFVSRVRRHGRRPSAAVKRVANRPRLRIGCIGRFRALLSFPHALFDGFPDGAELHVFDLAYDDVCGEYLSDTTPHYTPIRATDEMRAAAAAINAADLDVLLNANGKRDALDLLDEVETPCVLHFCPGSDLLHHPRVAVHMNGQPQADYFFADGGILCGTTGRPLGPERVYPTRGYYEPRDIRFGPVKRWAARQPLIVFHGSLYKLAAPDVLRVLFEILADDRSLTFVVVGRDSRGARSRIEEAARRYGVLDRVHFEGAFFHTRSAEGGLSDPVWRQLLEHLANARLAPDPWPIGGASARFEAFSLGAPSVHMGVRHDPASWGRPQPAIVEVPHMMVPAATASTVEQYAHIARRCLSDARFADDVADAQQRIARELADPARLWLQVFDAYREWLVATGHDAVHVEAIMRAITPRGEPVRAAASLTH
jgi:hypothetical protein